MRVAVSGATGLIGEAMVRRFSGDYDVVTIGRRPGSTHVADFAVPETINRIDLSGIDIVVHCAGIVDEDFKVDAAAAFRQATAGMAALVDRALVGGAKRFVYVSSAHVYGPLVRRIDERSPANPLSDYALAHFASEQILRRATTGSFRGLALRPCAVFGVPSQLDEFRRWGLIPFAFPKALVTSRRIVLNSSGEQSRNFVGTEDIADVARAWIARADADDMSVLNPVGRQTMTVWQFAETCADVARDVVGGEFELRRPVETPEPASSRLDYASIHPELLGKQDMRETVRTLVERLTRRP